MGHQKEDDVAELFNEQCRDSRDSCCTCRTAIVSSTKYLEKSEEEEGMADGRKREHDGDGGGYDPLEYLPEEIWEVIFGFMSDSPKTLISCCNTSISWDNLLSLKKSTWLFGEIFPFVFNYLKNQDILKCRRVCKSWRNAVDKCIEDHPCHHPSAPDEFNDGDTGRESVYYPLIAKKLHQIRFSDPEDLTKFRLEMEHTSRNPTIGRSVCFYSRLQDEWMMNALHFLSEFGRHIWYFTFESFHSPLQFLQWLRQCLVLLPNLKRLRIYSARGRAMRDEDPEQESVNVLMQELESNPLPELPSLETLEILTANLPGFVQDTVLSTYAKQLHRLELDEWDSNYINKEMYPLTDLKELILKVGSNDVLESLSQLQCPILRKLTLYIRNREIDLTALSSMLTHFGDNLRVLKITLTTTASFKMEKFLEAFANFVLPKLKVLVLVNAEDLPYNFLNGIPSVEYLHFEKWKRTQPTPTDHLSFVQIKGYIPFSSKLDSKIWVWDVLPRLKRLTFLDLMLDQRKKVYNRKVEEEF